MESFNLAEDPTGESETFLDHSQPCRVTSAVFLVVKFVGKNCRIGKLVIFEIHLVSVGNKRGRV